ncbi:MAG TPA: hypothetical protein GXX36_14925 [Clostridiaceae bacterium]|nr:hypothetical protein [Clostridiaceae bacterium]
MLIDTVATIAYKCSVCGSFNFTSMSLFELRRQKEHIFICDCRKSQAVVKVDKSDTLSVLTPCIGCGEMHLHSVDFKDIMLGDVNSFICPNKGIEHCFIGKDEALRKTIDRLEREQDNLIDTLGYDSYFKNSRVMLDSLNKIHDIAEKGNLFCECGNKDIEVILLSDRIFLKCRKCSGRRILSATSNKDLKDIVTKRHILLVTENMDCDAEKIKNNS